MGNKENYINTNNKEKKEKITILSLKDLKVSYFCGPGAGGTNRNKTSSGVQMIHEESGAIGRASDSRSQGQNKKAAFERLLKTPQMKFWLAKKVYEVRQGETLEETINNELNNPKNLKYEIKIDGKWTEIPSNYFDTEEAKKEIL